MKNKKNKSVKYNISGYKSKEGKPNNQVWEQPRTDRNRDRNDR